MNVRQISCFLLATTWSVSVLAAEPSMRLTIPRTAKPPTLDGKIAPDEWNDAAAVTGIINQFDGLAHPRQATFWIEYDDKNVYVAQRSSLLPGEHQTAPAMPALYFKDNQNAVVIALAPNRVNSGDTPSHYRFMANINSTNLNRRELCEQIKGVKFISISSSLDSLEDQPNNTKAFNSFSAGDTIWESEYVIPLSDMKVEKAPVGEDWGILLARDYPQLDQNAIVQTTSYRFDSMPARSIWRYWVLANAYHLDKEYARARFTENEPVVQVLDLGDVLGGRIKTKLAFSHPTAPATSVTANLTVGSQSSQQTITLAAGERKEWTSDEIAAAESMPQTLKLSINDAGGKQLYQQTVPLRAGYGRDRTTLIPDVWFAGEPKLCASEVVPLSVYNPIHNTLWVKVGLMARPDLAQQKPRAEISIRRRGDEKPFVTYPMSADVKDWGNYELKTKLPDLKPGVYEVTASLFGNDDKPSDPASAILNASNLNSTLPGKGGKLLARGRDLFIRYDHEKDLPWIGNKIGVTDKVLPPWTPIVTKETKAGIDLSCWGRTYEIDGSGLPTQIKALDKNILSGPIHIEVIRDGKPLALTPATQVSDVNAAGHEVRYLGSLQGDGWKIVNAAHLEYDGYLQYRIRLEPQGGPQRVDSIKFVIPLTYDDGRYMHAASTNLAEMRAMVTTNALKTDKGPLWDSSQQAAGPVYNGHGLTVGNFKSYVWVGGVKRGLAFLADSDKDWVPDDTKKVSSSEITRTDTGVSLVLNLVSRPFTFDHAREITFSLQATPVRPLTDDFRQARNQLQLGTAFVGPDPDGWGWNGGQLWLRNFTFHYLGGQSSAPFPINWDRNKEFINGDLVKRFGPAASNGVVTAYQAMDAFFHHPEIDDPRVPGLQGANWYGYLTPEITGHRDVYDAAMSRTEVEYRIWRYQRWIKETGLHGFYFDNSFTGFNANPDAGLGYVIDLPDRPNLHGKIQPGFAWAGIRDMLKRLRTVIVEEGHRPYLWIHGTDTFVIGAYAFADFVLDGEDGPNITPKNPWFSEKWSPEYMQTLNDSSKWGLAINMLDAMQEFTGPNDVGQWRLSFRDYSGYLMLHDNEGSTYRYLDWNGLDLGRKADFLPYWDPAVASALNTGNYKVFASGWRQDNALRVIVFNRSSETQNNLTLVVDPKALGIAPVNAQPLVVKDLEEGAPQSSFNWPGNVGAMNSRNEGKRIVVTMNILPHDYRLLRIEQPK